MHMNMHKKESAIIQNLFTIYKNSSFNLKTLLYIHIYS